MTVAAEPKAPETVDTLGALLKEATQSLESRTEARWVVANVAGIDPSMLPACTDEVVSQATVEAVRALVTRRLSGEPLQHVLGVWAFRTLEVDVDRRVLVPRPETEVVAGIALDELIRQADRRPGLPPEPLVEPLAEPLVAVDLGTGSGVIALSIAAEWDAGARSGPRPPVEVWATDVSPEARAVFDMNLETLRNHDAPAAGRVRFASGSWFDALPPTLVGGVDVIVSNPPYVSAAEWHELDATVRDYEPEIALVAGPTGREALETLIRGARRWLAPEGALVVELAPHQVTVLRRLAARQGYVSVQVRQDLAGRDRVLVARNPK